MNLLAAFRKFWYVYTPDQMQRKMLRRVRVLAEIREEDRRIRLAYAEAMRNIREMYGDAK